jgi:uncharacterized membrane protein
MAQSSGMQQPQGGLLATLRQAVANDPAAQRLVTEAQAYAKARGERLLSRTSDRLAGVAKEVVGGSPIGQAAQDAVKGSEGGPIKAVGRAVSAGAGRAVGSVLHRGDGQRASEHRRSTSIIEDVDIGVPIAITYDQWTQFPDFASFAEGVEAVDWKEEEPVESTWRVKIGPSRRSWKATTKEQIPERRVSWGSEGAKGTTQGVVTFHPLADDLTRVIVVMEYFPAGPVEIVGNLLRLQPRRVREDLRSFKRYITMQYHSTGAWRGEIRDAEVVRPPDGDGQEPERRADSREESREPERRADSREESREPERRADSREESREPATRPEEPPTTGQG